MKIFKTPSDFTESTKAYLQYIEEMNAPRFVIFDAETGVEYESVEEAQEDGVENIRREYEHVPPYALMNPTMSGFCAFMGMSLTAYRTLAKDEEFIDVVEIFETRLESTVEQFLINPHIKNVAGVTLVAKNRHGWKDKKDVEQTVESAVQFNFDIPSGN